MPCCLHDDRSLPPGAAEGAGEEDRKKKPTKVVGKVLSVWDLINKIVATIFIVIFLFLITLQEAWDGMGTNGGWERRQGLLKVTEQVRVGLSGFSAQMAACPLTLGPSGEMGPVGAVGGGLGQAPRQWPPSPP